MRYRRDTTKGGTWFFTVNLTDRSKHLLVEYVDTLRDIIGEVKNDHPFVIDAMVVLPDHMHAIWTLPDDDNDFSTRWGLIKAGFSRQLPRNEIINTSRICKGERGIWQRRFWEHRIRNELDFEQHVNYIHYNPVKHGYVNKASDWPYSSIHKYIKHGLLDRHWGCEPGVFEEDNFGE